MRRNGIHLSLKQLPKYYLANDFRTERHDMYELEQRRICDRYGAAFSPSANDSIIGVALNVKSSLVPVNGLRNFPAGGTNGWYIWSGQSFPEGDDSFVPLHLSHLQTWNPLPLKYLALPPGWRFLSDGPYEDVWFDSSLLIS